MEANSINELAKVILEQSPQVAKEYLAMQLWLNQIEVIAFSILAAIAAVIGVICLVKKDKIGICFSSVFFGFFVLIAITNEFDSYKARTFPKAYLLEEIIHKEK